MKLEHKQLKAWANSHTADKWRYQGVAWYCRPTSPQMVEQESSQECPTVQIQRPTSEQDLASLVEKVSSRSIILLKIENIILSKRKTPLKKGTIITIINSFLLTMKIFQLLGRASLSLLCFPRYHGSGFVLKKQEGGLWITNHNPSSLSHFQSKEREGKEEVRKREAQPGEDGEPERHGDPEVRPQNPSPQADGQRCVPQITGKEMHWGQTTWSFRIFHNNLLFLKVHYLSTVLS